MACTERYIRCAFQRHCTYWIKCISLCSILFNSFRMKRHRSIKVRIILSKRDSRSHTHSFHGIEERGFTAQSRVVTIDIAGKKLALSSSDIDDAWNRIIKINK